MHFAEYHSPLGKLLLCSDGAFLTGLRIGGELPAEEDEDAVLKQAKLWLDDYFRGENREVDFPLRPEGTDFQKQVWRLLVQIPYGQTTTYGALARQISEGMSAQAVGQAVGRNPIGILIPCHRVVGSGGKPTGYAWGIEKKQWLLEHEEKHRN